MAMNIKMTGVAGFVENRELDNMAAIMNTVNEVTPFYPRARAFHALPPYA